MNIIDYFDINIISYLLPLFPLFLRQVLEHKLVIFRPKDLNRITFFCYD